MYVYVCGHVNYIMYIQELMYVQMYMHGLLHGVYCLCLYVYMAVQFALVVVQT